MVGKIFTSAPLAIALDCLALSVAMVNLQAPIKLSWQACGQTDPQLLNENIKAILYDGLDFNMHAYTPGGTRNQLPPSTQHKEIHD